MEKGTNESDGDGQGMSGNNAKRKTPDKDDMHTMNLEEHKLRNKKAGLKEDVTTESVPCGICPNCLREMCNLCKSCKKGETCLRKVSFNQ